MKTPLMGITLFGVMGAFLYTIVIKPDLVYSKYVRILGFLGAILLLIQIVYANIVFDHTLFSLSDLWGSSLLSGAGIPGLTFTGGLFVHIYFEHYVASAIGFIVALKPKLLHKIKQMIQGE
ncbi:hypothetical protein [Acidianus manzaensis]|uniref:hypothetical protein n=1 Tax=Acidianus manzaensis TaxID=282676 RepID=UPI0011E5CEFB|nr:hypothetical protein [Acidianus manzaensis]